MADSAAYQDRATVVIFGDGDDQAVSKAVWSALSGIDARLVRAHSYPLDDGVLENAHLIIIYLANMENNSILKQIGSACSNILGITLTDDMTQKAEFLALGCSTLVPYESLTQPSLRSLLVSSIARGRERLLIHAMAEEGKLLDAAIDNSPESFILFDSNRKLTYVSTHFRKAYPVNGHRLLRGIDVMEAFELGREEHGIEENDPRYHSIYDFWQRLDGQTELELDTNRIWRIIARKLPDNMGTMVTTTDISKYVRQQREIELKSKALAEALEKEKEASEIQKQFINMVSHEFRTPLSIIDGNAQLLQRRAAAIDKDMLLQKTSIMRSAVSRLVGMMEGVLSSNMLKTGKFQLVPETFDVKALIDDLCREHEDLSDVPFMKREYINVPDFIHTDRKAMTLILGNLIANAVKFSRANPQIGIQATVHDNSIKIIVEDNGIGVPAAEINNIFTRYYRASTASGTPGTGIGLSLVKGLVDMQAGRIQFESREGVGSKVTVELPLQDDEGDL